MSQKTKERILSTALNLFNSKGLSVVSTRQITVALDISQGHLTYYFNKRAEILETLFAQFQDQFLILLDGSISDSYYLKHWLDQVLEMQYEYRFLFLDFAQVMRESPKIKKEYYKLRLSRKQKISNYKSKKITDSSLKQIELLFEFGMMYDVLNRKLKKETINNIKLKILELMELET